MQTLTLVLDCGSSLTKVFYSPGEDAQPQMLLLPPYVVEQPKEQLLYVESQNRPEVRPERSAWIESDGICWAIGYLAGQRFNATLQLKPGKLEAAIYKTLAAVGVAAQTLGITGGSLVLGLLLPFGEYADRDLYRQAIVPALQDFCFRGQSLSFEVQHLFCKFEGFGLLSASVLGESRRFRKSAIAVLGYRNTSVVCLDEDSDPIGLTTDLGFARMLEAIQKTNSGLTDTLLLARCVHRAGLKVNRRELLPLVKNDRFAQQRLETLAQSIPIAQRSYWAPLTQLFAETMGRETEQILWVGGPSDYFRPLLQRQFRGPALVWGESLAVQLREQVGSGLPAEAIPRLLDAYGFWFYVWGRCLKIHALGEVSVHA